MGEGQVSSRDPVEPVVELDAGLGPEVPVLPRWPAAGPGRQQPCACYVSFGRQGRGHVWEGGLPSPGSSSVLHVLENRLWPLLGFKAGQSCIPRLSLVGLGKARGR